MGPYAHIIMIVIVSDIYIIIHLTVSVAKQTYIVEVGYVSLL